MERRTAGESLSSAWLAERLAGPARAFGLTLDAAVADALARYVGLVLDWGARINLTGARTAEALADEHLADALALLPCLPGDPFRFIDVGSGAGLPGLPLALLRPDAAAVLLEPIRKKQAFLSHAIRSLGLAPRVEARAERLEAHLAAGGRGAYDVALSRATWPAARWLELGLPLVRPGGRVLGVTGAKADALPADAVSRPYRLHERQRAVVFVDV